MSSSLGSTRSWSPSSHQFLRFRLYFRCQTDVPHLAFEEFSFNIIMKIAWKHAGRCELFMTLYMTPPEATSVPFLREICELLMQKFAQINAPPPWPPSLVP
jgi:hypothetical protein